MKSAEAKLDDELESKHSTNQSNDKVSSEQTKRARKGEGRGKERREEEKRD